MSQIPALKADIEQLIGDIPVTFGVAIKYFESGETLLLNNDRTYQLASVFKIPVLVTAIQQVDAGRLRLDDRIELMDEHKTSPSGILPYLGEGLQPTIKDLLMLMIIISDNTATDMVLNLIGGPNAVNASLRELGFDAGELNITMSVHDLFEDVLGTSECFLRRSEVMAAMKERSVNFEGAVYREGSTVNVATPGAMTSLNEMIFRGQVASREACDVALDILLHQTLNARLPSKIPPDAPDVEVAHKTGTFFGVRNDSGIIYVGEDVHVGVTVLTRKEGRPNMAEFMGSEYQEIERQIDDAIGNIGRLAHESAVNAE
jgi:beta-lactamase class A